MRGAFNRIAAPRQRAARRDRASCATAQRRLDRGGAEPFPRRRRKNRDSARRRQHASSPQVLRRKYLFIRLRAEMLVGRNHAPSAAALALTPPEYRRPVQITNLPDRDDSRDDTELLALMPDVYVDLWKMSNSDYVNALEAITTRTHVPGIILEGGLSNVPTVYRKLGAAFRYLAARRTARSRSRAHPLEVSRRALAASGVKAYLACSQNALSPCLEGQSSGEAAALLGAINVAGSTRNGSPSCSDGR